MRDRTPATMNRRQALTLVAVTAASPLIPAEVFAQRSGGTTDQLLPNADVCVLTPETTAGPFYFDPALERVDISEGRPGLNTHVRLQVVDAMCRPLPGARVDLWHCDAAGLYSGYPNQGETGTNTAGETFMRGTQFADADGTVSFDTIYPGWYPGRTTHMHFKVFLDDSTLLTGQIFFPDEVSQRIYGGNTAYQRGIERQTFNDNDGIALQAGAAAVASVDEAADEIEVAMIVGVAAT